ncbi:MAG: cation-translocating P-type ATPase [Coriobacteriia bacterium]
MVDAPASETRAPLPAFLEPASETLARLCVDADTGLGPELAAALLAEVGPNELAPETRTPPWRMLLGQFNDFMIWVLLAAVAVSALEGEVTDAVAITAILVLNGILGFAQEYRAERAMDALKELSAPTATVVRGGSELEVDSRELVPGDIVLLEAGDRVPADGRLVEVAALRTEEASLTGESRPASKTAAAVTDPEASLGDRIDMVFAGTSVAVGRGRVVVTATGPSTEMGRIAGLLAEQEEERTPLQRELKDVGKRIALLVLAIAAIVFAVGVWRAAAGTGEGLLPALAHAGFRERVTVALLVAISLAVAAIPEGLPAIVTVALSLGVRRMAERNAIVKKLHAVETLGSTTFICSDKTGTLTRNEMTVRRLVVGEDAASIGSDWSIEPSGRTFDGPDLQLLLEVAASCNDARIAADGTALGDPTETALLVAADRLEERRLRRRRVGEVPFDSERKRMTTVHATDEGRVAYMKGGADVVLGLCESARLHGETVPMTDALRARLHAANEGLASTGYRTLAFAVRELGQGGPEPDETLESGMTYLGIMGLVDPARDGVKEAVELCHRAGIHVAMVTGDHALTARAVGDEIGLLEGKEVVTGARLERMDDDELASLVEDIRIYARVDPVHKLRIVDALKRRGHTVAMTGDGVNDAPALKKADIGVAMGRVGTDVSREAADMVLADDDFSTIVVAVREGRVVYDNLRKFILFLLSCNVSEVLIVFTTSFFTTSPALLPLQLLWINLVTDGLPALALGVDPPSPRVMERAPRAADESILTRRRQLQVLWQGAAITLGGLSAWVWTDFLAPGHGPARAQTVLFTTMVLAQLLHAFDFRSETRTVWSAYSLRNRWLVAAFAGSATLQCLVVYVPALQRVFGTTGLGPQDWLAVLVAATLPVAIIDAVKLATAARRDAGDSVGSDG